MTSQADAIHQTPSNSEIGEFQHERSTWDESSLLLPGRKTDDTVKPWSKRFLAPGFIWIETGMVSYPMSRSKSNFVSDSN